MKKLVFEKREDWLASREGKITGTGLGELVVKRGDGKKMYFYELIATRLTVKSEEVENETPMERGTRLEPEAIARFAKETGKEVDTSLVLCVREDNQNISYSPDALVTEEEDVEAKCLSSAHHIKVLLTQEIPSEYEFQVLQGFIVNDKLQKRNVVFFDPRIGYGKDYFVIEVNREDVQEDIDKYLQYQRDTLEEINNIVGELTGF